MSMPHPLVTQLRFARSEIFRCLDGVSEVDGVKRLPPMNCISWNIGHLAFQEQLYWCLWGQGRVPRPELYEIAGWGCGPNTPALSEMWEAWREVTGAADEYLDTISQDVLVSHVEVGDGPVSESVGTMLLRNVGHYWFHLGESHAIRQMLGHTDLPQFVGNMAEALYQPEPD
jgi:hypothetical protein